MANWKHFFKAKGALLALGLMAAAAGVAGFGALDRMISGPDVMEDPGAVASEEQEGSESVWQSESGPIRDFTEAPVHKTESGIPKKQTASSPSSRSSASDSSPSASGETAAEPSAQPDILPPPYVRPVAGDVMAAFSGEELVYNETLDDWRTHNGTDFYASYGEAVHSVAAGTVRAVKETALWGWTVEVEGPDGLIRYTGLAKKPDVRAEQTVDAGDVIGHLDEVGAEIALAPHLHVEYEKDGALCDVMSLLAG